MATMSNHHREEGADEDERELLRLADSGPEISNGMKGPAGR
jgi:hypothetical protein